jgi:ubiquinol-cytochrome c reductase cytochrome b subunit
MFSALVILLTLPYLDLSRVRGFAFKPVSKTIFFVLGATFIALMILGAKHVESPFIELGMAATFVYFAYFLINTPFVSIVENMLLAVIPNEYKVPVLN